MTHFISRTGYMILPNGKGAEECRKADGILGEYSSLSHTLFGLPNTSLFSVLEAILIHFLA